MKWLNPYGGLWATKTSEGRTIFVDSEAVYIRWTSVSDGVETSKLDVIERFPSTYEGWHRIFDAVDHLTSIEDAVRDDWDCATSFLRKWEGPLHPLQWKFHPEYLYSDEVEQKYNDDLISQCNWEIMEDEWKGDAYEVEMEARAALNILLEDFLQWLKSPSGQMTVWDGWKPKYGSAETTIRVWDTEGEINEYLEEAC
tara:strand:+ start:479 stop:1072 length:594 start_codon:yes stop_codon:yes gene_type:complete